MASRNRVRSEVGKGAEALRSVDVAIAAGTAVATYLFGPFETDIDVKSVYVATGGTVTAGSITITNAGTANAIVARSALANATAYSSLAKTVDNTYARIKAGDVGLVTINGSYDGGNANVKIGYDIPIYDPTAKYTTYGSYDDGI